jgi:hypothetical protein
MIGHDCDLGLYCGGECDKSGTAQRHGQLPPLCLSRRRRPIGSAVIIDAANDDEAIAQAEVVRGSFAAELLDIEGLRIVKYLPGTGRRQK